MTLAPGCSRSYGMPGTAASGAARAWPGTAECAAEVGADGDDAMSCEQAGRDLDAYLDGELDAGLAMTVRDHVGTCAACRRHVGEREALSRLVGTAPYYSAPERLR